VVIAPLGRTNIPEEERLDLDLLARRIGEQGKRADTPATVEAIVAEVALEAKSGDTVAVLSNGAFGGIHAKILDALSRS
jgi:UDP-N-acetylmuramate: L-alanyl-gamma-D-glutamyl-meso-diaminopimelate ligase